MEFGIWVEPEMINQDSDLYRNHPDWVLKLDGYPLLKGRDQLLLDFVEPGRFRLPARTLELVVGRTQS